jgi:hypothetical protein
MGRQSDGRQKRFRRLQKAIKPYGLRILAKKGGHLGIFDTDDKRVAVMSESPTSVPHAEYHTFKFLQKNGHVPKEAKL